MGSSSKCTGLHKQRFRSYLSREEFRYWCCLVAQQVIQMCNWCEGPLMKPEWMRALRKGTNIYGTASLCGGTFAASEHTISHSIFSTILFWRIWTHWELTIAATVLEVLIISFIWMPSLWGFMLVCQHWGHRQDENELWWKSIHQQPWLKDKQSNEKLLWFSGLAGRKDSLKGTRAIIFLCKIFFHVTCHFLIDSQELFL